MFTAPAIPCNLSHHSQETEIDTFNGFDGDGTVTVITRPLNVIGTVPTSFNTIPEALPACVFSFKNSKIQVLT